VSSFLDKYVGMRKSQLAVAWKKARLMKVCYLFLLPFAVLFLTFNILPMITSIFYSFTYYNLLQKPIFIGFRNYINLFLQDDVFLTAVKNTFLIAVITGPVGYIMAFIFAWFINELPHWIRTGAVIVFYAPSIAGNVFFIFTIFFRGDAYGYVNAFLMKTGIVNQPLLWLTDPRYIMPIIIGVILWTSLGTGFLAFVAGLKGIDRSQYEAGYIDGIQNRWQELWFITLPNMKPMLLFGAVMAITSAFNVYDATTSIAGNPSVDYAARTVVEHLIDYGSTRYEMGYASAIATILFLTMIVCNKVIQSALNRVGK